jgi:pimeloyl-ACP methyl ester carboxylesterase
VETRFNEVERMVAARLGGDSFMKLDTGRALQWIRALRGFWLTEERLRSIKVPTLIVASGLDAGHFGPSAAMGRALHARLSNAILQIAPDYGTLMLLEAPQEFWRLARSFYVDNSGALCG